eukprot:54727-Eustigmatos_ZCMA.PRE.1
MFCVSLCRVVSVGRVRVSTCGFCALSLKVCMPTQVLSVGSCRPVASRLCAVCAHMYVPVVRVCLSVRICLVSFCHVCVRLCVYVPVARVCLSRDV